MKIFVINLKSSLRRRKLMEQQLNKLGLPFEFFEAIQGSAMSKEEIATYFDMEYYNNPPYHFTAGIAGCIMSHYFLYKKIVEENIESALILEDDMLLNKKIPDLLTILKGELRDYEVIMLFYQSAITIELSKRSCINLTDQFSLYQVISTKLLGSTAGYAINLSTAKSMTAGLRPFSTFPDAWEDFYNRRLLNGVRVVYPFPLKSSYERTTISPYRKGGSTGAQMLHIIEKYNVFPFYQVLKWRRRKYIKTTRQCKIVNRTPQDFREK
ncbi:MAG TPA: glycosyltransferase family 25 protein [Ginsengibacter sp.]